VPTKPEIDEVMKRLPPPYDLKLSTMVELIYEVPSSRLIVPAPFKVVSVFGKSMLSVLIAHYSHVEALGSPEKPTSQPYDEIGYLTQARKQGTSILGNYYFKLHLNSYDAWVLGRGHYGDPKVLEKVAVTTSPSGIISVQASDSSGQSLESLDLPFQESTSFVGGIEGEMAYQGLSAFSEIFSSKHGTPMYASFGIEFSPLAHKLDLKDAHISLPYAVSAGLLTADEVSEPTVSLSFDGAELTLHDRQTFGESPQLDEASSPIPAN
jgi:hypothetical protein